jgi:hypothetical protein
MGVALAHGPDTQTARNRAKQSASLVKPRLATESNALATGVDTPHVT